MRLDAIDESQRTLSPSTMPRRQAQNIVAHERLFRLGIASNLTVFAADVVLIVALYIVLGPVNRGLALLAIAVGSQTSAEESR